MGGRVSGPQYRLTRLRGGWAVAIYQGGERVGRYALKAVDRKDAEVKLAQFVVDRSRPTEITVAYIWQRYRDENAHKRVAANMAFSGKAILPEFGHLLPSDITTAVCRAYMAKRRKAKRKEGTIWTELNHLQIALNWAVGKRLSEPVAVERPMKPPPRDVRISKQEAKRLREASDFAHIRLAIGLLIGAAGRIGAVLDLTWDRVDLKTGVVRLADPDDTAARKGRATVTVPDDLLELLREARKEAVTEHVIEWAGRGIGSIKRGFALAAERAGLPHVTPHVLRHSAATWMAEAGRPIEEIGQFLGHTDYRVTYRIYARYRPDHLRKAAAALDLSGVPSGNDEPANENET